VSQGRAAAKGFSPTSLRAHWIGPEGRAAARGPQLPRATQSPEFSADEFCTVMCFGGFLGAFQVLFLGSSSVLDHTPFHLEKTLIFEKSVDRRTYATHLFVDLCVDPPIFQK